MHVSAMVVYSGADGVQSLHCGHLIIGQMALDKMRICWCPRNSYAAIAAKVGDCVEDRLGPLKQVVVAADPDSPRCLSRPFHHPPASVMRQVMAVHWARR